MISHVADGYCPCGLPLHYTDPVVERLVRTLVRDLGEFVTVKTPEGSWRVSRHYLALHGVKAADLPRLGFEKAKEM
jgi:hypothetical protein